MIAYVKTYTKNFHGYFHMLGTVNTKLISNTENCSESNIKIADVLF
jgi:hypothetical protein